MVIRFSVLVIPFQKHVNENFVVQRNIKSIQVIYCALSIIWVSVMNVLNSN